jgi:hypothetical protein
MQPHVQGCIRDQPELNGGKARDAGINEKQFWRGHPTYKNIEQARLATDSTLKEIGDQIAATRDETDLDRLNEAKHGLTNEKIMLSAAENAFFNAVALNEIDPAEVQSSASDRRPSPDARTFESDPAIDEKNMQHACSVECVHDDAHAEPKSCGCEADTVLEQACAAKTDRDERGATRARARGYAPRMWSMPN